eukprot:IDg14416t1
MRASLSPARGERIQPAARRCVTDVDLRQCGRACRPPRFACAQMQSDATYSRTTDAYSSAATAAPHAPCARGARTPFFSVQRRRVAAHRACAGSHATRHAPAHAYRTVLYTDTFGAQKLRSSVIYAYDLFTAPHHRSTPFACVFNRRRPTLPPRPSGRACCRCILAPYASAPRVCERRDAEGTPPSTSERMT